MFASIGIMSSNATLDPNAVSFFNSTSISDATIKGAVSNLAVNLKREGLWNSFYAIWPFVGGTSTTCSYNLINTALYQLTYTGSPSFAANGMTPSNNNYADSNFNDNLFTFNNACMGYYSRTNNTNLHDIGCSNDTTVPTDPLQYLAIVSTQNSRLFSNGAGIFGSTTTTLGFGTLSSSATNVIQYHNGVQVGALGSAPTSGFENLTVCVGSVHDFANSGQKQCALAFVSQNFTATQQATLYALVQNFQIALGRQV